MSGICSVTDCGNPVKTRGFCRMHYKRMWLRGSVERACRDVNHIAKRFWMRTDQAGGPDACWPWIEGVLDKDGYGHFRWMGPIRPAHLVAWELTNGPKPDGLNVCHSCDNPACCNPRHLWLGTQKDNVLDCIAKGRWRPGAGERHGSSKLTDADVAEIRRAASTLPPRSGAMLGRQWRVSRGTIYDILRGRTRKQLDEMEIVT